MKKIGLLVLVAALFGFVQHAQSQDVKSVNVVGFVKKQLPASGAILTTCNFDQIGGGNNTLLSIFGTNQLKQADDLPLCDRVSIWNTGSSTYSQWVQWTDGQFYEIVAGDWGPTGDPAVPAGSAIWVIPGGGATARELVFTGEVIDTVTQRMTIVAGPQIVAYPFTSSIGLQETTLGVSGHGSPDLPTADRVSVWTGSGYNQYALYDGDNKWYPIINGDWGNDPATNTLELAQGFWYIAQSGFTWSETNKYLNNL